MLPVDLGIVPELRPEVVGTKLGISVVPLKLIRLVTGAPIEAALNLLVWVMTQEDMKPP